MLNFLAAHLPQADLIPGKFIEPFVGGGAVYFHLRPSKAILGDLNADLMDIYRGIQKNPDRVWRIYRSFPRTKRAYKEVRDRATTPSSLYQRAARALYLNRTCFKGMWRHNRQGRFNIGYGGQDRRWSLARRHLMRISNALKPAILKCCDFECMVAAAVPGDFLFLDPPYRPGEKEQVHDHYVGRQFSFEDHQRLASALKAADKRGVRWALTVSSHPAIKRLYAGFTRRPMPRGTGRKIGQITGKAREVLVTNS